MNNFKEKADKIWEVANLLRGDYKRSDYGKVILPMTVLRRLDCVLRSTKKDVLAALPKVETSVESAKDKVLNKVAGHNFHNRSKFDFEKIVGDPNNVAANLRNYINGFSSTAREIIEYFNFDDQIDRMDDPKADILFRVVKAFQDIDLTNMQSMEMGYAFEYLIRKFAEQSNETAGEHFTPREVIKLMVNMLFNEDSEILTKAGKIKTLYDPACGTGGMLSIGEQYVKELNPKAELKVFGQEINPESYAICKSDMLIKGQNPSNIKFGNTFTIDGLEDEKFDYMLSNPPFGVDWKKAQKIIKAEHEKMGMQGRFGIGLPRINDGSLLFLQHMISKMKPSGTRIAVVFNGSPLFSGSAGSGESEIRKWIIENDWLEAIVSLPDQLFYNTGISTYIWIVNNKKTEIRKGKVQLINATGVKDEELIEEGKLDVNRFWKKMDRSLGNKRKEIPENGNSKGIEFITQLYGDFQENEFCKILPNDYFAYWRITVEQPLKDEDGEIVKSKGKPKADSKLRDYENIPFLRKEKDGALVPQTIEEYYQREVKPHLPESWIDHKKTKVSYEIKFTDYFHDFKSLRSLEEIKVEIQKLEKSIKVPQLYYEENTVKLKQVVTKGITQSVPMQESGIDWLGAIPKHWKVMKLNWCFKNIGSGTTPKAGEQEYYFDGKHNWLLTGDLTDGEVKHTTKKITDKALQDYSSLKEYPINSIVIAMYGATIGKLGLLKIPTTVNQACCVFTNPIHLTYKYAFYVLLAARQDIISMSYGGGQPNISQALLRQFKVPIPPKSEQIQIVEFIETGIQGIDNQKREVLNYLDLLTEYRTTLISEVVTGKIKITEE